MPRALCIVLDSVGCGHAPDAADFGDAGSNTLGHLFARIPDFELPNLASLGLYEVMRSFDPEFPLSSPVLENAAHSSMCETSVGKDTTTGHWEIAGNVLDEPFATFESFPDDLLEEIGKSADTSFIGNFAASGTEIIKQLGEEHIRTGKPIVYTSADSVLQIAAHEEHFGLERLYQLCQSARDVLDRRGIRIGRVIARPFIGEDATSFQRTSNRHDYSLQPLPTILNRLQNSGIPSVGVGKISDIFAGSGISESHPTKSNSDGMATIDRIWAAQKVGFIFANLVDFDMHFGHRRDPEGYANCLREFDVWLGSFLPKVGDDFLLITADHGNDPYHPGTDHTREQVPLLTLNPPSKPTHSPDFTQVATLVGKYFQLDT
ncbi:phosphopentomutase [Haloferula chungangensis]|uniref:Phosphopentomutase n=1 Tax=Haloferula chungangensis TaxID=1048331 RepID=A0ABW2L659_9BACT